MGLACLVSMIYVIFYMLLVVVFSYSAFYSFLSWLVGYP